MSLKAKPVDFSKDKYIAGLKPKEVLYFIREARGFTIRVMPSGLKTWLYKYTWNGKRKQMWLGEYNSVSCAQARVLYTAAYNLLHLGVDPMPDKSLVVQEDTTFGAFSKLYVEDSINKHCTAWHKTLECALKHDVLPFWKDRDITTIKRRDAIALLERVERRGAPGMTSNVQKSCSAVLGYALDREYIEINPMYRLAKVVTSLQQKKRERTLDASEIKHIWQAIDNSRGDSTTKRALKLILVTAQRPGEVAGMHRREIVGNTWTIPKERMKVKVSDHVVHLTPTALELIGDAQGYIFPSPSGDTCATRGGIAQLVSTNRLRGKLPYYGLPRWTPHDLRRTARSNFSELRVPLEHAEAVLAHGKQGVRGVYDRYHYTEEKKEALSKWEARLLEIIA